jgi:hypothetical protein
VSEPSDHHDQQQARELDEAASRAPLHARDRVPDFLLRSQGWLHRWLSNESRIVLGVVIVILALVVLGILSSMRFLRVLFDALDVVAFLGLFLVNWLGNGGVLVPIPGARFIGLLMIFQQAVLMPSWEVFAVAGAAMALGLLSYYVAGARTAQSYAEGDTEGAQDLAAQTGMLDDEAVEFSPGAGIDAAMVSALSGVEPEAEPDAEPAPAATGAAGSPGRLSRLRKRFTTSLKKAQERARPVIEQRGATGMFLLCFAPSPMGTAAAYMGGLMRFGFVRYLGASFAAKYLLAGIIVVLALVFNDAARAVEIPELTIPIVDITLFDDASPAPSPAS